MVWAPSSKDRQCLTRERELNSWTQELMSYRTREGCQCLPQSRTNIHLLVFNSPAQPSLKLERERAQTHELRNRWAMWTKKCYHKTKLVYTFLCLSVHLKFQGHNCSVGILHQLVRQYTWLALGRRKRAQYCSIETIILLKKKHNRLHRQYSAIYPKPGVKVSLIQINPGMCDTTLATVLYAGEQCGQSEKKLNCEKKYPGREK